MLNALLRYVGFMGNAIKREDVLKTLNAILETSTSDVIPALENVVAGSDVKEMKDNNVIEKLMFMSKSDFKSDNPKDFVKKLAKMFKDIDKNGKDLVKIVENDFSKVTTNLTITAKDAAILKVVNDIGVMNNYVLDMVYISLTDKDDSNYPKSKFRNVSEGLAGFSNMIGYYNRNIDKVVKNLPKIADVKLDVKSDRTSFLSKLLGKSGATLDLPTSGFSGNPIYHVRMWMVDREMEKYEALKDKKELIKLKLMELKLKERNESSAKLKKQIDYYEDKLSKIDYEISQIEES